MGGRLRWLVPAALVVAGGFGCSANDPPGGQGRLSIATGGSGGVYQVYGGGLADVLSDSLPDSPTTAETTSASVDNLILVANGDSDIAFTLADTAIDAARATRRSSARSRFERWARCTRTSRSSSSRPTAASIRSRTSRARPSPSAPRTPARRSSPCG
jgi:hypothetical protein